MKRDYQTPNVKIVKMRIHSHLLAESDQETSGVGGGTGAPSEGL